MGINLIQIYLARIETSSYVESFWNFDLVKFQTFQIYPKFMISPSNLVHTYYQNVKNHILWLILRDFKLSWTWRLWKQKDFQGKQTTQQ